MKIEIRNYVVPSIPMALLLIILVTIIWFSDIFIHKSIQTVTAGNALSVDFNQYFNEHLLLSNIVSLLLTALNALLLGQLNNKYTIIRTRTFLPVLFYVLLMASWHETHTVVLSHLVLSFVMVALFVIFNVYRNRNASEQAFLSSFLIAVSSLFFEPMILYIPLIWIGIILFHSLSLRNFLATLIGAVTPWILYLVVRAYLHPDLLWLNQLAASFDIGLSILTRPLSEIIYISVLFILFMIGLVGLTSNMNQDSMQTRSMLTFIIYFTFLSFVFSMVFEKHFFVFLPFVGLGFALLLAHPITLKKGNFFGIIFLIFIVVNIAFVGFNVLFSPQ
ncbi:MAG: DUF6427 family protein [Paludibacter sp.]